MQQGFSSVQYDRPAAADLSGARAWNLVSSFPNAKGGSSGAFVFCIELLGGHVQLEPVRGDSATLWGRALARLVPADSTGLRDALRVAASRPDLAARLPRYAGSYRSFLETTMQVLAQAPAIAVVPYLPPVQPWIFWDAQGSLAAAPDAPLQSGARPKWPRLRLDAAERLGAPPFKSFAPFLAPRPLQTEKVRGLVRSWGHLTASAYGRAQLRRIVDDVEALAPEVPTLRGDRAALPKVIVELDAALAVPPAREELLAAEVSGACRSSLAHLAAVLASADAERIVAHARLPVTLQQVTERLFSATHVTHVRGVRAALARVAGLLRPDAGTSAPSFADPSPKAGGYFSGGLAKLKSAAEEKMKIAAGAMTPKASQAAPADKEQR